MAFSQGVGPSSAQHITSASSFSFSLNGTTAGRHLVVGVGWASSSVTITSITCTGEADLTIHDSPTQSGSRVDGPTRLQFASLPLITAGGNKTITVNFSGPITYKAAWALEVYGGKVSNFYHAGGGATAVGTNPAATVETTNPNCLIVASNSNANTPSTAGSGYTFYDAADIYQHVAEYKLDSGAAGTINAPFVNASSQDWVVKVAAFNAASDDAIFTLPLVTLVAGESGALFNLPVSVVAAGEHVAIFDLPGLQVSGDGCTNEDVAFTMLPLQLDALGGVQLSAFTLPLLAAASDGNTLDFAIFSLLSYALDAFGLEGGVGSSTAALPSLLAVSTGESGDVGSAVFDLPALPLQAYAAWKADFPLPAGSLVAAGATGNAASADFFLPLLAVPSAGYTAGVGGASFFGAALVLAAEGLTGGNASAVFSVPSFGAAAAGASTGYGFAAFNLAALDVVSDGFSSVAGSSDFVLPRVAIAALGAAALTAAYRTWCLNTRRLALTEYDNFQFNSFARFNGQYLACSANGVVVLGASDSQDGASPINAVVQTGQSDFSTSHHKRVPRIYMNGSAGGDLYFRVSTVEGGERTYILQHNGITGTTQRRVPVGKGPRSRFFQFGVDNIDGADFSIASVQVYPSALRRRIS